MSYAKSGLQGVGIAIPNPDINLHPQDTSIDSIFNPFWQPTPFVAPAGPLNTGSDTTATTSTSSTGLSKNWLYGGLAIAALLIFGKKQ